MLRQFISYLLEKRNRASLDKRMSEAFKPTAQRILESLKAKLTANDSFEGICAVEGGVHGYNFYFELVELKDGSFLHFFENDFNKDRPYTSAQVDISLSDSLNKLRQKYGSLQGKTVPEIEPDGRYAVMCFVFRDDADWLVLHRPLTTTKLRGTTLEKIYFAVAF